MPAFKQRFDKFVQILFLSARNLLRQKRRSLFLGLAIGFGMMLLIMANSCTFGLTDLMLNKLMVYSQGHIKIAMNEGTGRLGLVRDRKRIESVINDYIGTNNISMTMEELMIFSQAVGNGKSSMLMMVGVPVTTNFLKTFAKAQQGNPKDMFDGKLENPIIIGVDQAKALNVKSKDIINIKFQTIYGQTQTARVTIAAIVKASNPMMSFVAYIDNKNIKNLMGYAEYESGSLKVVLKKTRNPKYVAKIADELHRRLQPGLLGYYGTVSAGGAGVRVTALSFSTNADTFVPMIKLIPVIAGSAGAHELGGKHYEDSVMLASPLAAQLGAGVGSGVTAVYKSRFKGMITNRYTVRAIFDPKGYLAPTTMLFSEYVMHEKKHYEYLPEYFSNVSGAALPSVTNAVYQYLLTEWRLLRRTSTTAEMIDKQRELSRTRPKTAVLDIATLYESFQMLEQVNFVLFMIALVGVVILFFIILIGVFNTLRMTIRERTREIGTLRAIGMQQDDVRNTFVLETSILGLLSSVAGVVVAFILMFIIGHIPIETDSMFGMFLYEKHVYFLPNAVFILLYLVAIVAITALVTFFPARHAAKMSASDALRHYE